MEEKIVLTSGLRAVAVFMDGGRAVRFGHNLSVEEASKLLAGDTSLKRLHQRGVRHSSGEAADCAECAILIGELGVEVM